MDNRTTRLQCPASTLALNSNVVMLVVCIRIISISTRASPQESGGQVHLMEDEIHIYETDLAESMGIWGVREDDEEHTSFQ